MKMNLHFIEREVNRFLMIAKRETNDDRPK